LTALAALITSNDEEAKRKFLAISSEPLGKVPISPREQPAKIQEEGSESDSEKKKGCSMF
jgi:hypothetical protein